MDKLTFTEEITRIQQEPPTTHKDEKLYKALEVMKEIVKGKEELVLKADELSKKNDVNTETIRKLFARIEKLEKSIQAEKKKEKKR